MKQYIMALDQGTTSSRAIIFDKAGSIISKAQNEFTQIYPQPGYVEHDPLEILYSQLRAAKDALNISGICAEQIAAIGITNQRETTVVWDKTTGRPIYNAIVWQCRRTAPICERLISEGWSSYVREKTGLIIDAYFSATKIKWILDRVSGAKERAERGELLFGTIDSWLIWNLTGGVHVTDYTNAARTMLFDIDKLCWDKQLCKALDIPMEMLPKVMPSSCVYGTVKKHIIGIDELVGIPIASAIGDQQAALFGQACFEPGKAKNTFGTGCFLVVNTGKKSLRSKNQLLTTIAWGVNNEIEYALEGSIFNAGSVIKWLRDDLRLIESASECDRLAQSVPDTGGVYFVPAFTGLGAPYWDMYARGTMVGITRGTCKEHVARAVLESIVYQVKDLCNAIQDDLGDSIKDLRVDGGASVSNIMMQFQADMLNVSVDRPKNVETTALGAAYLAGLAVGVYKDKHEIESNRKSDTVFLPNMSDDRRNALYSKWSKAVERAMNWADE